MLALPPFSDLPAAIDSLGFAARETYPDKSVDALVGRARLVHAVLTERRSEFLKLPAFDVAAWLLRPWDRTAWWSLHGLG